MTYQFFKTSPAWRLSLAALLVFCAACGGGKKNVIPPNVQPDRYLMDRANEAVMKEQWLKAREYFKQVVDNVIAETAEGVRPEITKRFKERS